MAIEQQEKSPFGCSRGVADSAKATAVKAGEAAKETAGRLGEMAQDAASTMANKTGEAASYLGQKADQATAAVGENLTSFAGTLRDKGPQQGILGRADAALANTLESCGQELERGVSGMANDVTDVIRRHPVPAVLVGIGLGFLIARSFVKELR